MVERRFTTEARNTESVVLVVNDEKFTGQPELPGAAIIDYEQAMLTTSDAVQAKALTRFFTEVFREPCPECNETGGAADDPCQRCRGEGSLLDEFKRFWAYVGDRKNHVGVYDLIAYASYFEEAYGARPTKLPAPSAPGQSSTESGSEEGSSSPE
jgi:hypothetical protein